MKKTRTTAVKLGRPGLLTDVARSAPPACLVGIGVGLLLMPGAGTRAASVTVNLNDGDCSNRSGVPDPCNVTDPSFAAISYVVDGVEHATGSANLTTGELSVRTESMDLDTIVPDAQTTYTPGCPLDPEPEPPPEPHPCRIRMTLQSPGGNLPDLEVLDRIEIQGFADGGNNGNFIVEAVEAANSSYRLVRQFDAPEVGIPEVGIEIEITRNEKSSPLATTVVEQLVLTHTDDNPFEIGAGRIGITFDVQYDRFDIPPEGRAAYDVQNETTVQFNARLDKAGVSTIYRGLVSHLVEITDEDDHLMPPGEEIYRELVLSNMQTAELERGPDGIRGRLESTVPILLEPGDTLTILTAFFRVGSGGDLSLDSPEPPGFDETLEIDIDVTPGSASNCINGNGRGVISVAILGSLALDAAQVDTTTLDFNGLPVRSLGNGRSSCALRDANRDGFPDTVCRFDEAAGDWVDNGSDAVLTGSLFDGTGFRGADSICLVPRGNRR